MKKHTPLKSKFNAAFSLVELLVVIAVIAVIAAIAIPNITGITEGAKTASQQRTAQNLASLASAARAAGYPGQATVGGWVAALSSDPGIQLTNAQGVVTAFRADGVPADGEYGLYLVAGQQNSLTYDPAGGGAALTEADLTPVEPEDNDG
jgi:type IV pilus assembly protein PilA